MGLEIGRGGFDPARPSLLMVHGSGGRGAGWLPQLSGLREVNVAALDLPGHGATPGPGFSRVEDYAAWVAEFIAAGPIRPVLMGHSLGGAIAQMVALTRPELLRGLILVGTGCRLRVLPAILEGLARDYPATVKLIVGYAYHEQADPRLLEQGGQHMLATPAEVTLGDFSACNSFDVCDRLGEIRPPTLCLVGDGDRLTPPKYSTYLAQHIPGARVEVIAGAGHMVFLEQPGPFNRAVMEFMAEL
jgi:pimeloyl-ACP methyl ester carboxylesterase